ncbi:hypothetical protein K6U06_14900 [Acidiferrimicrobium sp. IK]|uniref:hypothetical protein n=1 Tax=Acidiferrimicrobium sp. IK TaxID=2871700 RepID=UPI0021CB9212|nr:hypothetical protein [Acidiferrimicrobium sp. IK]MCU4185654.1 hypothetical protein [Acidiferrimicrobium sp. IK]
MIVIGLLLLAAAAAFGVDVVVTNSHRVVSPSAFGQSLGVHTDWWVFVIGAITGAVALLGLALMTGGAGRARRNRRMARRNGELTAALAERDRLAQHNQALVAERDRMAGEREGLLAERDRLAGQVEGRQAATAERGGDDMVDITTAVPTTPRPLDGGWQTAEGDRSTLEDRPMATAGRKRHFWER